MSRGNQNQSANASRASGPGSRPLVARRAATIATVLTAVLFAGCGAASSVSKTADSESKDTKALSGVAPQPSRRLRSQEAAIHKQVLAALQHPSHSHYGGIPPELRNRQAPPANQVLSATASHPADAVQGVSVELHLPHGAALATAVGPDVPDRIQGSADLHTPATWDLTFADVHGTVPITPSLFTITDEQGAVLRPHVSVSGGGSLPKTLPTGHVLTLKLSTVVSVGDGKLRYAPTGRQWLAEWDFDVETD